MILLVYIQEVLESMDEALIVAAITEAAPAEAALLEEPIPQEQGSVDAVSTIEEESITTAAPTLPVTITEQHVDPKLAPSVSSEVAAFEPEVEVESSVSVEQPVEDKEPEMVRSSPVEDARSSVEKDVLEMSPAAAVAPAACGSETSLTEATSETIKATEEATNEEMVTETIATEDALITTALTADVDVTASEAIATEGMPVDEELGKDIFSSEAPTIIDAAAVKEAPVTMENVSPVVVEELITFENTDSPMVEVLVPVPVQSFPDLALDPLLEPLDDAMPVLMPFSAQEEQTTALPVKPEDNIEPVVPLQAEPEVLSPAAAAPAVGSVVGEAGSEGIEEPAEDLEAELNDEVNNIFQVSDQE